MKKLVSSPRNSSLTLAVFQIKDTAHENGGTVLVASYDSLEFLSLATNTMPLPVQRAVQQSQKFKGEAVTAPLAAPEVAWYWW